MTDAIITWQMLWIYSWVPWHLMAIDMAIYCVIATYSLYNFNSNKQGLTFIVDPYFLLLPSLPLFSTLLYCNLQPLNIMLVLIATTALIANLTVMAAITEHCVYSNWALKVYRASTLMTFGDNGPKILMWWHDTITITNSYGSQCCSSSFQ